MPRKPRLPTEGQLAILAVLWDIDAPSTVREVHEALPARTRRGYTTTLKLMQLMVEQGLLERDEHGRAHTYRPRRAERQTQRALVDDLVDRAFRGSASKLVMRALERGRTSDEELDEIRRLLDQVERERGEDPS